MIGFVNCITFFDVATMPVANHKKKQELPVSPIPLTYPNEPAGIFRDCTLLQHLDPETLQTVLTASIIER
ncbi:hypothetical protein [Rahnella inusitata]|uniref:hypothetical protein n=1 Tax=Rahnella inusitata TaxID=58169 RepID=UPI0039AE9D1A